LADKAGLNLRTVQRLETRGAASLRTRAAIARALDVPPAALDLVTTVEPSPAPAAIGSDTSTRERAAVAPPRRRSMLAGLYALSALLLLGFVMLDQLYARALGASAAGSAALSEIADFLLLFSGVSLLLALCSFAAVRPGTRCRRLLVASVFAGVILPPAFLAGLTVASPAATAALAASGAGAALRLAFHVSSAMLAVWAWSVSEARTPAAFTRPELRETGR
jgi:hypothetical protein